MPALRTDPRSCTAAQRQVIAIEGKKRGFDPDTLRSMAGVDRLHDLSAAEASSFIRQLSGMALPNEPGKKPRPYFRRKAGPQIARLITDDHCEQITRLTLQYFDGDENAGRAWFIKNWKVDEPWKLGTADRAAQVIVVLKEMCERKSA